MEENGLAQHSMNLNEPRNDIGRDVEAESIGEVLDGGGMLSTVFRVFREGIILIVKYADPMYGKSMLEIITYISMLIPPCS